jgi:hypothetical protein
VLPIQTVYASSGWDSYSWAFQASHGAATLIVHNPGVSEDPACGPLLDSFAYCAHQKQKILAPCSAVRVVPKKRKCSKKNATNIWPCTLQTTCSRTGDFEEGPYMFPGVPWGVLVPPVDEDDYSPLPPWMVLSATKSVKYLDAAHHAVPRGAHAVELLSGTEAALAQDVATVTGRPYRLEFSAGDGCVGSLSVRAYAARGSVTVTVPVPHASRGKGGHRRGVLDFTAVANQTRVAFVSMAFTMKSDGTLCGPVLDDVSLVGLRSHAARRLLL